MDTVGPGPYCLYLFWSTVKHHFHHRDFGTVSTITISVMRALLVQHHWSCNRDLNCSTIPCDEAAQNHVEVDVAQIQSRILN